ncbi:PepSY domain-containing protein [Streptomyces megasporus]|uniref:PepSY domain-containing protein n=1 Tax=Streptomyces megasporus TaxID=44060 RepID=UPI0004E1B093|nr:PepSY domain-containing protein [Streptomyces megasporus]
MNRKLVIAAVTTAALAVGGSSIAFAGDDTDSSEALAASLRTGDDVDDRRDDDRDDRDDRDDDRDGRDDDHGDDRDDRRELRDAKVTLQQAVAAALKAVPGTAESVELEDDDRLVWDVDLLGKDGKWYEITVDANNADILERDVDSDDDRDDRDDDRDDRDDRDDDRDDRDDRDDDRDDD